jgi:hypothetical protein
MEKNRYKTIIKVYSKKWNKAATKNPKWSIKYFSLKLLKIVMKPAYELLKQKIRQQVSFTCSKTVGKKYK